MVQLLLLFPTNTLTAVPTGNVRASATPRHRRGTVIRFWLQRCKYIEMLKISLGKKYNDIFNFGAQRQWSIAVSGTNMPVIDNSIGLILHNTSTLHGSNNLYKLRLIESNMFRYLFRIFKYLLGISSLPMIFTKTWCGLQWKLQMDNHNNIEIVFFY